MSIIAKLAKFDQLKTALNDLGVTGMTVTQVMATLEMPLTENIMLNTADFLQMKYLASLIFLAMIELKLFRALQTMTSQLEEHSTRFPQPL